MELLKLSKFKLQLQSLATELRDLRVREKSATEQCHILSQRQKQTEEEFGRKLQELQSEFGSSNELCQKLQRKVNYLQNDNALLENRHKELQATIQNLLQSRESFINAYEESTCEMKRAIEARDRKLRVLNEKLNSHLSLFDSIEKEACSIKQVMNNVQLVVCEKEEVVAGLKIKMDKVCAFEKVFSEKVHYLETKLKINEDELQKKDEIISELDGQLEAAKIGNNFQIQIEELQKNLTAKDAAIQNLISDREALYSEVEKLAKILQKVKETVTYLDEEDRRVFNCALNCQEDCDMVKKNEENSWLEVPTRMEVVQNSGEASPSPNKIFRVDPAENQASPACEEQTVGNPLPETIHVGSCVSETESPFSELQSASNGPRISVNTGKEEKYSDANVTN